MCGLLPMGMKNSDKVRKAVGKTSVVGRMAEKEFDDRAKKKKRPSGPTQQYVPGGAGSEQPSLLGGSQ